MSMDIIDEENVDIRNFPNVCRSCGVYSKKLSPIDDVIEEGINLKEIITRWIKLELKDDEQFPKNICKSCIKSLYQMYYFLMKWNTVTDILNKALDKFFKNFHEKLEQEIVIKDEVKSDEIGETITDDNHEVVTDELTTNVLIVKDEIEKVNTLDLNKVNNGTSSSVNKALLKTKRSSHQNTSSFKCITCDAVFDKHEDLKIHKLETKHNRSLKYSCPHCPKRTFTRTAHIIHVRTHTGEKPNKCPICGKGFNSSSDMQRHQRIHTGIKPYKCEICKDSFSRKGMLRDHQRKHTDEKLICSFCGKHFLVKSSLINHEKFHKEQQSRLNSHEPLEFTCELCGKCLTREQTLKDHMLLHGPKNFICQSCGKAFFTNSRLQAHNLSVHQEPQFQCNTCGKVFKQKSYLENHENLHSGQKKYDCTLCHKQFLSRSALHGHKKTHANAVGRNYQRKVCSKTSTSRANLDNHMPDQSCEKNHKCNVCAETFSELQILDDHIKIVHTEEIMKSEENQ